MLTRWGDTHFLHRVAVRLVGKHLLACATLFLLLGAGTASAATYTVTTLGDSAGTCSGTSPNFSCTTLRAAITAANATTGVADAIVFGFGVTGTINVTSALPWVTDTLTINGSGITLNGGGGSYGAIWFTDAGASGSQLLNTTITNFNERTIWAWNAANITISNNTITMPNNNVDAIRCLNGDNCTVTNNTINGGFYGIAMYNEMLVPGYSATVTGNVVTGAVSGIGLFSVNNVTVDNNTVTGASSAGILLLPQWTWNGHPTDNNVLTNNTITGGSSGIVLAYFNAYAQLDTINNTLIQGNSITGNADYGIWLFSNSSTQINGTVITGNTIANNGRDGVAIMGPDSANNAIYANSISTNGGLGIDLNNDSVTANDAGDADTGPNGLQNFPVLTGVTGNVVSFVLDTTANANGYRIDFYNNPGGVDPTGYGEGQVWLGSCIVASPSATIPSTCTVPGVDPATLRMTATQCSNAGCTSGSTSEFSGPAVTDLGISKTDGVALYVPGQSLTYTIVVTNGGATPVVDAIFTDPAVSGLTINSVTCGSATPGSECPAGADTTPALMQGSEILIPLLAPGGSVTFTVTATVSASMTGALANTATITPPSGVTETAPANNSATDTDTAVARVTISKVSLGGVGSFDFTGDNGIAAQTLTTTVAGTPVSGATQVLTTAGAATTITEAAPPAGYTLTGIACTGLGTGGSATPDLATRTVTLDAAATAAGANITCTFTNTLQPTLALAKIWVNAVVNDTTTLSTTGGTGNPTLNSTANTASETDTGAAVPMAVGDVITLAETLGAGNAGTYSAGAWSCTGGSLAGSTLTLAPADAGQAIVCTITNTRQTTDVQVVKTAAPDPVVSGDVITYTLTATNNGPLDATNAVLTDAPGAGLDCVTPSPTASCSASGGASCPGATVAVSDLLGAGVTIPALPVGGEVVVTMQCKVTATGM